MEQLPYRGRPVTERDAQESGVSPGEIQKLQSLLKELYKQRPVWRKFLPPLRPPTHKAVRMKLGELKGVEALYGAKVLYLDDTSQCYLPFLTDLTLATRRRVERIFYHGETVEQIAENFHQRLRRCPQPHLLIVDEHLEMLPSFEYAGHTEKGHKVLEQLQGDLRKAGVPPVIFSSDDCLADTAASVGAQFVRKNIPPEAAVEQMARYLQLSQMRMQTQREEEERFITTD
ncbi:MAG: hypothetical protein PHX93_01695 [Candidatus Peribacteraceae bacterium]|nr:hypothetical protein [Candidatus Peribacteraceae bacterium]